MDRPHLIGWSSLCRVLPISDAPRRQRGHCLVGSRTDGKLARRTPCGACLAFDPCDRDHPHAAPCGGEPRKIGAPSVVLRSARFPRPPNPGRYLDESVAGLPHRSHLGAFAVCVSTLCEEILGQRHSDDSPCGSSCGATRDASNRLLPSHVDRTSTRASLVLDVSSACAPSSSRRSPASRSGEFASAGRTSSCGDVAVGVVFPP